jgi:type I restriction enzyme S subunit
MKFDSKTDKWKLKQGDLLLTEGGDWDKLGRGTVWREEISNCIHQNHIFRARLHSSAMEPKFFSWYANEVGQRYFHTEASQTVNLASINLSKLRKLEVAVPPACEQQRIVVKVEALLARVNAARQRLAKAPAILKRFRQSVLAAACSGRLTADWREEQKQCGEGADIVAQLDLAHEAAGGHKQGNAAAPTEEVHDLDHEALPPSWAMTNLRSAVCPDRPITYGILKPGPGTPSGIPYVRVADFPNDRLNLNAIKRTTKEIERTYARARLRRGDILLSIRGTVGRVCVVPAALQNANITQDTARLSIQPLLDRDFVVWFLRAFPTQLRMQKALKGVAVRGINIGDVRALPIPIPPDSEQREIVRRGFDRGRLYVERAPGAHRSE